MDRYVEQEFRTLQGFSCGNLSDSDRGKTVKPGKGEKMKPKWTGLCLSLILFAMILAVGLSEGEDRLGFRFADAKEAAELLLSNRDYYDNLNQMDLDYRMQKKGATLAELEAHAAKQTRDFTPEEKDILTGIMAEIEQNCRLRGYTLPVMDNIVFAQTTMHEECDAMGYTHGTQIYLGEAFFEQDHANMLYVAAHEVFHCLTRNDPDFREAMYRILGFTVVEKDFDFGPKVRNAMISNPDVEHHNSYASFSIGGKMMDCAVVFTTRQPFKKPGDSFFTDMMTGLVPIDDLSFMYDSNEASNFWDVFGRNTAYVIDPEETLADNFALTVLYGPEGLEYSTPEIIRAIDTFLRQS